MYNVLKYRKNDEIKTKSKFNVTATEPHRNRKFRQFNNEQYCIIKSAHPMSRFQARAPNCIKNVQLIIGLESPLETFVKSNLIRQNKPVGQYNYSYN